MGEVQTVFSADFGALLFVCAVFDVLCCKQWERTLPGDQPQPEHTNEQGDYGEGIPENVTNVNVHASVVTEC